MSAVTMSREDDPTGPRTGSMDTQINQSQVAGPEQEKERELDEKELEEATGGTRTRGDVQAVGSEINRKIADTASAIANNLK